VQNLLHMKLLLVPLPILRCEPQSNSPPFLSSDAALITPLVDQEGSYSAARGTDDVLGIVDAVEQGTATQARGCGDLVARNVLHGFPRAPKRKRHARRYLDFTFLEGRLCHCCCYVSSLT